MTIWKLKRLNDGLEMIGNTVHQLVQKPDGVSITELSDPLDLRDNGNIVLDLTDFPLFTWATTYVEKLIEQSDTKVKFETTNSTYILSKIEELKQDET